MAAARCASEMMTVRSWSALRLNLLRPFEALRAQLLGFALALGLHAVVDRLAGLRRQVGAMETNFVDLEPQRRAPRPHLVLDDVDDLGALVGQQAGSVT